MSDWTIAKLSGHCGARLSGGSRTDLSAASLAPVRAALYSFAASDLRVCFVVFDKRFRNRLVSHCWRTPLTKGIGRIL